MVQRTNELQHLKNDLQTKLQEMKQDQLETEANINNLVLAYDNAHRRYIEECSSSEKDISRLRYSAIIVAQCSRTDVNGVDKIWRYMLQLLVSNGILPARISLDVSH